MASTVYETEIIACDTRAYIATRIFYGCRAREMTSEIPEIFYAFGPRLHAFISVGILLKRCRRKLLQFASKTVLNLGMSRFISPTKLCSAASFTKTSHYSTLNFTRVEDEKFFHNACTATKLAGHIWI